MLASLAKWATLSNAGRVSCQTRSLATVAAQHHPHKVDKNVLMKLRRKTGYSFVNCRKAIEQFGDDLQEAEKWLHDLARKEGWQKAVKLQHRATAQGLIGVLTNGRNLGVMVEVNCETDFVSRNEKFRTLVSETARCALEVATSGMESDPSDLTFRKWDISREQLMAHPWSGDNTFFGDHMAYSVGQIGENLKVARSRCVSGVSDAFRVIGYAHPRPEGPLQGTLAGQFGAIVALERDPALDSKFSTDILGQQLCQHIIGMAPTELGTIKTTEEEKPTAESSDLNEQESQSPADDKKNAKLDIAAQQAQREAEEKARMEAEARQTTSMSDETALLRQDFLLHPDITVGQYVTSHGARIVDFARFAVGETQSQDD